MLCEAGQELNGNRTCRPSLDSLTVRGLQDFPCSLASPSKPDASLTSFASLPNQWSSLPRNDHKVETKLTAPCLASEMDVMCVFLKWLWTLNLKAQMAGRLPGCRTSAQASPATL